MSLSTVADPYEALRPVMTRYGASGSAREFYWAVNSAYHSIEAHSYDELHESMFVGLTGVWERLLGLAAQHPQPKLRVLDVGAGTGLVGGFLEMHFADRVEQLTLLDPCAAMLEKARTRAQLFSFPSESELGEIDALGGAEQFDVITVNSVLHHIVELPAFFAKVSALLRPQGWLLTAQDPRAEAGSDQVLSRRRNEHRKGQRHLRQSAWKRFGGLLRKMTGRPQLSPLALQTSEQLLQRRAIQRPMGMAEIYAVTDYHVPGQPGGFGEGIAVSRMQEWLPRLTLEAECTYQYHGVPWTDLTPLEQEQETRWWSELDAHGQLLATAWRRNVRP